MSLLNVDLNSIPDKKTIPAQEVLLGCVGATLKASKAGNQYLELKHRVIKRTDGGNPNEAFDIFSNLMVPNPQGADMSAEASKKRRWVDTLSGIFQVDVTSFDTEQLIGKQYWALIEIRPAEGEFPERNEISKFEKPA